MVLFAGKSQEIWGPLKVGQRWLPAKNFLAQSYGISVHFSDRHANYYTAGVMLPRKTLALRRVKVTLILTQAKDQQP